MCLYENSRINPLFFIIKNMTQLMDRFADINETELEEILENRDVDFHLEVAMTHLELGRCS